MTETIKGNLEYDKYAKSLLPQTSELDLGSSKDWPQFGEAGLYGRLEIGRITAVCEVHTMGASNPREVRHEPFLVTFGDDDHRTPFAALAAVDSTNQKQVRLEPLSVDIWNMRHAVDVLHDRMLDECGSDLDDDGLTPWMSPIYEGFRSAQMIFTQDQIQFDPELVSALEEQKINLQEVNYISFVLRMK